MPRTHHWTWLGVLALAAAPTLVLGQAPAPKSHTVRAGDTLWDLARTYKGDPFLWPDIYRLNTSVVEDPHWIYPGEVLSLDATAAVAAVPAQDTPAPDSLSVASADSGAATGAGGADSAEAAPAEPEPAPAPAAQGRPKTLAELYAEGDPQAPPRLFGAVRGNSLRETLRAYTERTYRPLRPSEFHSSGFLTEGEKLPYGEVIGMVTPPQIDAEPTHSNALPYARIAVQAPKGAVYQAGDTLLVLQVGNEVKGFGDVVVPTGLARVVDTAGGRYLAEVVALYGPIRRGQQTLPAETFVPAAGVKAVPVSEGVHATLLGGPRRQDLKAPQMVLFLDKGKQDGVARGDLFEIRRHPEHLSDGTMRVNELMATLQVVHVREHSATAIVLGVVSPDIQAGASAVQVAKLP
jgi:LysM domain-containing protein